MKILYVDDTAFDRLLFQAMFKHDFDLILADSGQKALQILADDPSVEVVVTDWDMPVMDGLFLIRHIYKNFFGKTCFLTSSCIDSEKIEPYLKKGIIRNYFHKPIDKKFFLDEINKINGS